MPSVSTNDNGKVLTVVNGRWEVFGNGAVFSKSASYDFGADYWNYRESGKTVTLGTVTIDSSYSYIEVTNSTNYYMNSINGYTDASAEIRFPDKNIIITKGNEYKVTGSLASVYGAFIKISYIDTTVSIISGFSSAAQTSISGKSECYLVFKAYI